MNIKEIKPIPRSLICTVCSYIKCNRCLNIWSQSGKIIKFLESSCLLVRPSPKSTTRLERPKGVKDKVKRPQGPPARSQSLEVPLEFYYIKSTNLWKLFDFDINADIFDPDQKKTMVYQPPVRIFV